MQNDKLFYIKMTDKNGDEFEISEEELKNSFAKCLKELRKYKEYTLNQVSDGTGIPMPTIQRYEKNENTPGLVQAYKLSCFYNMSIKDMFLAGYLNDEEREKIFDENLKI